MADVPRDPRQLARDILAGKISIEELAREQQRRRMGGAPGGGGGRPMPMPQARVPDRVPLPRTVPPPVRPVPPRPVVRQAPVRPPVRPPVQPPVRQAACLRAVITAPPPRRPEVRSVVAAAPVMPSAVQRAPEVPTVTRPPAERALNMRGVVGSRTALRQGIVLAEILGKPVALREE